MSYKSYILSVCILRNKSLNFDVTRCGFWDGKMVQNTFSARGCALDPAGGACTTTLDLLRPVKMGERWRSFPGSTTFWHPAIAETLKRYLSVPLIDTT